MSVSFRRHVLSNGLRLLVHEDATTPLVSCNLVYHVGSRDEQENHTGLAHLFEHYMFCGSVHILDYDTHLQKIGAINNAYTSQDHTHYFITLPANNLETALWLESDRMLELAFSQEQLDIQKNVVIEELKEVCLNRPFGDLWALFNDFVFEKYPYKWMPIGKSIAHIEATNMEDMRNFYYKFYRPDNAVLVIGGNVHFEEVVELVEKWFADIPRSTGCDKHFPVEPLQTRARTQTIRRPAPYNMLLKGWKMPPRLHPDFYGYDFLSDLYSSGQSSYLFQEFVVKRHLFTDISMSITGNEGPGIYALVAQPAVGVDIYDANEQLNSFLYNDFSFPDTLAHDLEKVKNKNEAALLQADIKLDNRTSVLAVSESISCAEDFANEMERYRAVSEEQIIAINNALFQPQLDNTLFYLAQEEQEYNA